MNDSLVTNASSTVSGTLTQQAQVHPAVAAFITLVVLATSLGLFVYFFLQKRTMRDEVQCHFALELLAIVITAFTAFLAIATGVVTQAATARGNFGFLTFYFVGPAAVWAGARALLTWAVPKVRFVMPSADVEGFMKLSEDRLGWVDYSAWREKIGRFSDAIARMEMHFIDDLLPKVFYHGASNIHRPSEAQIRTVFIYRGTSIIKLQRIQGMYSGIGERPRLYLPSTSSTTGGKLRSVHAFQEGCSVVDIHAHANGDWVPTMSDGIDCIVCTIYENDAVDVGDYLYIDTTKYVEQDPRAYVELSVLSDVRFRNLQFWELRASTVSGRQPVPLIFRHLPGDGATDSVANKSIVDSFSLWIKMLRAWHESAKASSRSDSRIVAFLDELWSALDLRPGGEGDLWERYVQSEAFVGRHAFWNRNQEAVLIATFEWDRLPTASLPSDGDARITRAIA
jgi:hypothetical protein